MQLDQQVLLEHIGEYAYIYNTDQQVVPIDAPVAFSDNGLITSGITHVPGSSTINIVNPCIYAVTYSVSGTEPNQFALFVNGVLVPGSRYGSGAGTQQNNGQVIVQLDAGDAVQLINSSSAAAVTLVEAPPIGGSAIDVTNASIMFQCLAPVTVVLNSVQGTKATSRRRIRTSRRNITKNDNDK